MRQKGESASLAERLNNAMAQLHSQKISFQTERADLIFQLEKTREENQRLRNKNKEMKRSVRQIEFEGNRQGFGGDEQSEQILLKIHNYLSKVQQSTRQMAQIANQCRIFDAEIEKASSQIQKNIIKSLSGLQKYSQELVRQWCNRQTLRLENQRLQKQNKYLFDLTTKLQYNFKEADRILKHLQRGDNKDENTHKESESRKEVFNQLQSKITRLSEKVRSLQQQNTTIKSIHQRTMKKLQKLQQKNRQREDEPIKGQGIQQQRNKWLEKTEEMYDEVRRLNKQLLIAEESEKKIKEQLSGCLQIYNQWQQQKEDRKLEIEQLKVGIETYLKKIEQLEIINCENKGEIQTLCERLQISQGQKQKIITVYQLQVQQINDQLFKKQDTVSELEVIIAREHSKLEELKKQYIDLNKTNQSLLQVNKKVNAQVVELKQYIEIHEQEGQSYKRQIKKYQQQAKMLAQVFQKQKDELLLTLQKQKQKNIQMADITNQYKEEYYSSKRQLNKLQETMQSIQQEQYSIKQQLKNMAGISNDTVDIWTLLGQMRGIVKDTSEENKHLKEAQRSLIVKFEDKQSQQALQIEEVTKLYNDLKQSVEDQVKNQQISLKIWKMKIQQREICSSTQLSKAKNMKQLIQIFINTLSKDQNSHPPNQDDIQQLKQQIIRLHQNEKKLKDGLTLKMHQQIKIQQQLILLRRAHEQSEAIYQQLQRDFTAQKQKNNELEQKLQTFKTEKEQSNKQMASLTSQLNKIQNQIEDFQDEKNSIQQKLQNAKKIFMQNQSLQQKVDNLESNLLKIKQQLQAQRSNYKAEVHQSKEQINPLDNAQDIYKSQTQGYLKQIKNLLAQNEQLHSCLTQKQNKIITLQESLVLIDQNNQMLQDKIVRLEQQLKYRNEQLGEYKNVCNRIQDEKEYFSILKEELQQKIRTEDETHNQQKEQERFEYIQLTLEIDAKMNQIDQLEQELKSKDQRIAQLQFEKQNAIGMNQSKQDIQHIKGPQRQQVLRLLLVQINQKQSKLQVALEQFQIQKERVKYQFEKLNVKQEQAKLQQQSLQQKQEYLLNLEKQLNSQRSQLEMQSMKESKTINLPLTTEESKLEQLQQQLIFTKKTILQRDQQIRQTQLIKKNSQTKLLEVYKQRINQLEEQLNQYKQYSQNLKSDLADLKEQKQSIGNYADQLKKSKGLLHLQLQQLKQLLQESELKNNELVVDQAKNESNLNSRLKQSDKIIRQQEQTILKNMSKLQEKEKLLQETQNSMKQTLKTKQEYQLSLKAVKLQNQQLKGNFRTVKEQNQSIKCELAQSQHQNSQYASRLNQIQQIMKMLRKEQGESQDLRIQLSRIQSEKVLLQETISDMARRYQITANNFENFEKKHRQTIQQLSAAKIDLQRSKQLCQGYMKQSEKCKQNLSSVQQNLSRYEGLGQYQQIVSQLGNYSKDKQIYEQLKQQNLSYMRNIENKKQMIRQLQQKINQKAEQIQLKQAEIRRISQQKKNINALLKSYQQKDEQIEQFQRLVDRFKIQIKQHKQQLLEQQQKIVQLKAIISKSQTQKQLRQQHTKNRQHQYELLQKQIQHYKSQMKKLNKQNQSAKSQMMKSKCSLQQQQSVFKMKESQAKQEINRNYLEKDQMIRQLKEEVDRLRESSSLFQAQSSGEISNKVSKKSSQFNRDEIDIPLQQMTRSRQKSVQSQEKSQIAKQQYDLFERQRQLVEQQNKYLKNQLLRAEKVATSLRQMERVNSSLKNEVQHLQRQMKGKSVNIESLQKQFKSKIEEYSKLERMVQSLRDELSLQRKRVKNFEDLYQSIHQKRIKLANNMKSIVQ